MVGASFCACARFNGFAISEFQSLNACGVSMGLRPFLASLFLVQSSRVQRLTPVSGFLG